MLFRGQERVIGLRGELVGMIDKPDLLSFFLSNEPDSSIEEDLVNH